MVPYGRHVIGLSLCTHIRRMTYPIELGWQLPDWIGELIYSLRYTVARKRYVPKALLLRGGIHGDNGMPSV